MKRTGYAWVIAVCGLATALACKSNGPGSETAAAAHAVSPETLAKGQGIYKATCAPCHGDGGKGDGPASKIFKPPPRDHTDPAYMSTMTDADMEKTIQQGGAWKGKALMPSNPQIRGDDMKALIAYVRSLSTKTNGQE